LNHRDIVEELAHRRQAAGEIGSRGASVNEPVELKDTAHARAACVADALWYLGALKQSLKANDVRIATDAVCESPLHESIARKVLRSKCDLVIKCASGRHPMRRMSFTANDWELTQTCPATLMLTRERPWSQSPRFAAAVDVTQHGMAGFARRIVHTADFLASGCQAELEIMYSEPARGGALEHPQRETDLERLAYEYQVTNAHVHTLQGNAADTVPAFAALQSYDALVLGAISRRRGLAALLGRLAAKLIDSVDSDVILVKPASYECPLGELDNEAERLGRSG
jgi:universal stress protein E